MEEKKLIYENTRLSFGPATLEEQGFCFTREGEEIDTACIGHLRGDFGKLGKAFHTTWWPHNNQLQKQTFAPELDNVVNALRCDGILSDRAMMQFAMRSDPQALIRAQYRPESAYRAETDDCLFFLRCIPNPGDYNFYLYAYDKERFYEVQRELKGMPRTCWSWIKSTNEIVILQYGEKGYIPFQQSVTEQDQGQNIADELNHEIGITKAQAAAMEAGRQQGWNLPQADPKSYDDAGHLMLHEKGVREEAHER